MGKVTVIALVAFTISGAYYTLQIQQRQLDTESRVSDHQYEVLARESALTGLSIAKNALSESFASTSFSGHSTSGDYSVSTTVSGTKASVVSTGTTVGTDGPMSYRVQAEFDGTGGTTYQPEAPEFLQYALISEQNITLGGNVTSEVYLQGEDGAEMNANIHTNGSLSINGMNNSVEGFGTYYGTASSSPAHALDGSFEPNYQPTEGPTHYQVDDKVDMPNYDAAAYIAKVLENGFNVIEHSGDLNLAGVYDYGPRENPTVVHVTGNLATTGGTLVNGYVMYIVDGSVSLAGNLEGGETGYGGPDESSIAIYSAGTVGINGKITIAAQIYSDAGLEIGVDVGGNPKIYGGLTTLGEARLEGKPTIYYRTPSAALAINWQDVEHNAMKMVSYSEW